MPHQLSREQQQRIAALAERRRVDPNTLIDDLLEAAETSQDWVALASAKWREGVDSSARQGPIPLNAAQFSDFLDECETDTEH